jgi:hypothetical protein
MPMADPVYLVWAASDEEPAMVMAVRPTYALAVDTQQAEYFRLSEGRVGAWVDNLGGTAYAGVGDHTRHVNKGQVIVDSATQPTRVVWVEEWEVQ